MATISIIVPDAMVTRVQTAFKSNYNFDQTANGLTANQFVQARILDYIKTTVKSYEVGVAQNNAAQAAVIKLDTDMG